MHRPLTILVGLVAAVSLASSATVFDKKVDCHGNSTYHTFYPGDCSKYIACSGGNGTVKQCGWFLKFDEDSSSCKASLWGLRKVNCSNAENSNNQRAAVASVGAATVGHKPVIEEPKCEGTGEYLTFYPGDCGMYVECAGGKAQAKSCGWFHRFDETTNTCKFHWFLIGSVNCASAAPSTERPTGAPTAGPGAVTNGPHTDGPNPTSPTKSTPKPAKKNAAPVNGFSVTLSLFFLSALFFMS